MSLLRKKFKLALEEYILKGLKDNYVNAIIDNDKITEVYSVRANDPNVDFENLLGHVDPITCKSTFFFKAKCENQGMFTDKIFEFNCQLNVAYHQKNSEFIFSELGNYFPRISSLDPRFYMKI